VASGEKWRGALLRRVGGVALAGRNVFLRAMKVLLINGSPNANGCTFTALSEVSAALARNGIESEWHQLGKKPVQGCIACRGCRTAKRCVVAEDANVVAEKLRTADGVVVGSPVYFAGPNGSLCALLDRVFFSAMGAFRGKPAAAVVSCRRGGASAAFDRLNKYFTLAEMPLATSQYWNSVHGNTPDEVRRDAEGLQVMRTLGGNLAWLVKNLASGGVPAPEKEERVATNFIR
jgi:multimeric flavodoxin WrbA